MFQAISDDGDLRKCLSVIDSFRARRSIGQYARQLRHLG